MKGSDFTSSVALLEKKLSKMKVNVPIGELGHLVDLVRRGNLAHNECVLFASRDVRSVACEEADSFTKVISLFNLDVFIGM